MSNIAAGRLRHIVSIDRQVEVVDSNGDHLREWQNVTSMRAEIKPMSGRELLLAQQVQSQVSVAIIMRYRSDIDATCRIRFNGATYNVLAVIHDADSGIEYITLQCAVGTNDG